MTNPVAHTPGPWVLDPKLPYMVYCDDDLGSRIADCSNPGRLIDAAHTRANTTLIAAAPALLKALEEAVRLCPPCPARTEWAAVVAQATGAA